MRSSDIYKLLSATFIPSLAIVVYQGDGVSYNYLEAHKINKKGELEAGFPLTEQCIKDVVAALEYGKDDCLPSGIIPRQLLYHSQLAKKMIWYNPPRKRYLYFSKSAHIPSGEYHMPGIIYKVEDTSLNVWSFKGKKVQSNTLLYHAPFMNVNSLGHVCLGNASLGYPENPTYQDIMDYWEKIFWNTEFSHGANTYHFPTLMKQAKEKFNHHDLKPAQRRLKELLA